MSTTVSYKGQTLTTVSNDTKTLLTEGKYLEDDLTLVDVSGGSAVLTTKNISANGTYNASSDSADGYSQVNVAVPNTYTNADEGKVVSDGALVAQTSDTVTTNDTYDTTLINSLTVNVSGGGGNEDALLDGSLTTLYNDQITSLRGSVFYAYSALKSVSLPNVTEISGHRSFNQCGINTISLPKVTTIPNYTFNECQSLTSIPKESFPLLTTINDYGFYNCQHLEIADFQSLTKIKGNAFARCFLLSTLIIRTNSVCELNNITAFDNTPMRGRDGKSGIIYVPFSLVDSYKTASNWSTIYGNGTCTFSAIEGSVYQ